MNIIKRIFKNHFIRLHGKNNVVNVNLDKKIFVKIYGDNNKVIIEDTPHPFVSNIFIGTYDCRVNNCTVKIGKNCSSNGLNIHLMEDDSFVKIGDDCMFSFSVDIWASDTHSILDKSDNLINLGKSVEIGNSVWIGQDARICKNTLIPDNCIVGISSVVTKKFETKNCVIAGNPAKVVKEDIKWNRMRPKQYLEYIKSKNY